MIDREARTAARGIANREIEPTADMHDKTVLYGMLGRGLGEIQSDDLDDFFSKPVRSFFELDNNLYNLLDQSATLAYGQLLPSESYHIEKLFGPRFEPGYGDGMPVGLRRMTLGVGNATEVETVTLRTIARMIYEGQPFSWEEVVGSYKLPERLALVHFEDLDSEFQSRSRWLEANGGDNGPVLSPMGVTFLKNKGLRLNVTPDWPVWFDEQDKQEHGPHIGCPATFERGYIKKIHEIASLKALEAGLISVIG